MTVSATELRSVLKFDEATQRLVWLPRKYQPQLAGKNPCRVKAQGYFNIVVFGRCYREHRVIWAVIHGEWPPEEIDHIDGNRQNNNPENLRAVSRLENARNMAIRSDNSSGAVGVDWLVPNRKWRARVNVERKTIHIGLYDTLEEAKAARTETASALGFHPNHGRMAVGASR